MKILIENWRLRPIRDAKQSPTRSLAREIGLEEAEVLLSLEAEIQQRGTSKNEQQMVARTAKQLEEMCPWSTGAGIIKILEKLQNRGYVDILEETWLLSRTDTTRWYALNWQKIRELKSIVVMSEEEEIKSLQLSTPILQSPAPEPEKSPSRLHQVLFGAFLIAGNLDARLLSGRQRGAIGSAVKKISGMYPNHDIETLRAMIIGFRVWWVEITGARLNRIPPQVETILSQWQNYADYCKRELGGISPEYPASWIRNGNK